jgi:hypothetical protein
MPREILTIIPKSLNFALRISVPGDLDYWTVNGVRRNFYFSRISNPDFPEYKGFTIILGLLSAHFAYRRKDGAGLASSDTQGASRDRSPESEGDPEPT